MLVRIAVARFVLSRRDLVDGCSPTEDATRPLADRSRAAATATPNPSTVLRRGVAQSAVRAAAAGGRVSVRRSP